MSESTDKIVTATLATPPAPAAPAVSQVVAKPPLTYTQKVLIAVTVSMAALLLAALVYYTTEILVLCFAGMLLAVFISAPADLLAKHTRLGRGTALLIVLLVLVASTAGGGYFMGYTITKQSRELSRTLPGALKQAVADIEKRLTPPPPVPATEPAATAASATQTDVATTAPGPTLVLVTASGTAPAATTAQTAPADTDNTWLMEKLTQVRQATTDFFFSESFVSRAGGVAGGVVSSTFGIIGNLAVVMGVGLFLAINPHLYSQGIVRLMPVNRRKRTEQVLTEIGTQLEWWFVGQLCSMISISVLTYIGLTILRVPMASTLAILAGLMNFIPNFGPILAAAPAVLIAFAPQGDQTVLNPGHAGWVIMLYVLIQLLEGWVITPFFQQRAVELPPALIIVSQVVFALLLGPLGLVLATPILAATLVLVRMVYVEDVLGDRAGQ